MSMNISLELSIRTDRTLPDIVNALLRISREARRTEHRYSVTATLWYSLVLSMEILQRHMLSIDVACQSRMVLAQWLHFAQLLQPLLLLDIVPTGVGISGDRLCKPSLEGAISGSEVWLDGRLEAAIKVRSEEMERGSAHTCMHVSTSTNIDVMRLNI